MTHRPIQPSDLPGDWPNRKGQKKVIVSLILVYYLFFLFVALLLVWAALHGAAQE